MLNGTTNWDWAKDCPSIQTRDRGHDADNEIRQVFISCCYCSTDSTNHTFTTGPHFGKDVLISNNMSSLGHTPHWYLILAIGSSSVWWNTAGNRRNMHANKMTKKMRHHTLSHYTDVIMATMASQITSLTVVYAVYSDADQRKHQLTFMYFRCNFTECYSLWPSWL